MLTDQEIQALLAMPKTITGKQPARGYRDEGFHKRCNLALVASLDEHEHFEVFVRQNTTFIENYSIGLRYQTGEPSLGTITLTRYNGPHGEERRQPGGHFAVPHIHGLTEAELASGSRQPQESHREVTDRYGTFEEALQAFFVDMNVENAMDYFESQIPLF